MENYFDSQPHLTPEEKTERLESLAVKVETITYDKEFSFEEIDALKCALPDHLIELTKKRNELKAQMKESKAEMALTEKKINSAVNKITNRSEEVTEQVFLVDDQELKTMFYINSDGDIVRQRPLLQTERQLHIKDNFNKTANS